MQIIRFTVTHSKTYWRKHVGDTDWSKHSVQEVTVQEYERWKNRANKSYTVIGGVWEKFTFRKLRKPRVVEAIGLCSL